MSGKSKKKKGTKQTLEYVEYPEKFHVKSIKFKNAKLKEFIRCIEGHEITICTGIAGSGKTYLACYQALKMLEKGQVEKIVLCKSVQTLLDEEVGFLPGDINKKLDPYMISFFGNIDKLIGEELRKSLVAQGKLTILPLAFIRGINIDNAIVILDECLNLTMDTFKSIVTRIGDGSKYIIGGDTELIDMKRKEKSSLSKILELFKDDDKIGTISFGEEDCVRNPIIPYILNKLKTIE